MNLSNVCGGRYNHIAVQRPRLEQELGAAAAAAMADSCRCIQLYVLSSGSIVVVERYIASFARSALCPTMCVPMGTHERALASEQR